MKKLYLFLLTFTLISCSSNSQSIDNMMTEIANVYSEEGYLTAIEEGTIVWRDDQGYNIVLASKNAAVKYYTEDASAFILGHNSDKEFVKMLSIGSKFFNETMDVSTNNTAIDDQNGLFRYGYSNDDYLCLISVPVSYLWSDKQGNSYVNIDIGCSLKEDLENEAEKIRPIYDDLGADENGFLQIDRNVEDKYFHLNGCSIFGGCAEFIVVKEGGVYKNIYGGNSGDIPCETMNQYNVPQEIYGDCYY